MTNPEWWQDFFTGLTVDMWGLAVTEEHTRGEADFIQKSLRLFALAKVLDVPCGGGRLSIELASRGFRLTAVDISKEFLQAARTNAGKRNVDVAWEHREMRDLPWQSEFDGVLCFGNSFGYLDDNGNASFLKAVHRVLKPGGRFVLDASSVAENVLPQIEDHTEMQIGDIRFIEDNRYDHKLGRLDTEYTFVKGDRTEKKFGSHRLYTYRELQALLSVSGFEDCEAFGSVNQEPFKFGSQGLFFSVAKK